MLLLLFIYLFVIYFPTLFSNWDYIYIYCSVIWWIGKNVEGSGCDQFLSIPTFACKDWKKHEKAQLRYPISVPRFETGASPIRSRSDDYSRHYLDLHFLLFTFLRRTTGVDHDITVIQQPALTTLFLQIQVVLILTGVIGVLYDMYVLVCLCDGLITRPEESCRVSNCVYD
jgi:hypothetical protein